jgi:hypothetical protein
LFCFASLYSIQDALFLYLVFLISANRSSDPAEEDDLALRILRLDAHWWPSWDLYAVHQRRIVGGIPYDFHFPPNVNVGYPSSGKGMWVFKFSADERTWDEEDERKPYLEVEPDD